MENYRDLLEQIRDHLRKYKVATWPERLDAWVRELDGMDSVGLRSHLLRTRKALGGMGSIGDVVLCPEAGDDIPDDPTIIQVANDHLRMLIGKLHTEIVRSLTERIN